MILKRLFDLFFSLIGMIFLIPIFIIIALLIKIDSKGSIFYKQVRVGKNLHPFKIYKFRTMKDDSDKKGLLSLGKNDSRITKIGHALRKYKLDELPQLINVLKGEMSFVGPRPEVKKYVDLYSEKQKEVLEVKPGITDKASLEYFEEEQLLGVSKNPEKTYIEVIMPRKIEINKKYLSKRTLLTDIALIFKTFFRMIK